MLATILTWVGGVLASLFGQWLKSKQTPPIVVEAEKAGAATQAAANAEKTTAAETAIANAEANAPTTAQGVEDRLNKGTF